MSWIIVSANGDVGEGPWRALRDAEAFLTYEVGVPAVVVEVPPGRHPYRAFRDVIAPARLFVEEMQPDPKQAYVYFDAQQEAVNAEGEFLSWSGETGTRR